MNNYTNTPKQSHHCPRFSPQMAIFLVSCTCLIEYRYSAYAALCARVWQISWKSANLHDDTVMGWSHWRYLLTQRDERLATSPIVFLDYQLIIIFETLIFQLLFFWYRCRKIRTHVYKHIDVPVWCSSFQSFQIQVLSMWKALHVSNWSLSPQIMAHWEKAL